MWEVQINTQTIVLCGMIMWYRSSYITRLSVVGCWIIESTSLCSYVDVPILVELYTSESTTASALQKLHKAKGQSQAADRVWGNTKCYIHMYLPSGLRPECNTMHKYVSGAISGFLWGDRYKSQHASTAARSDSMARLSHSAVLLGTLVDLPWLHYTKHALKALGTHNFFYEMQLSISTDIGQHLNIFAQQIISTTITTCKQWFILRVGLLWVPTCTYMNVHTSSSRPPRWSTSTV